VLSIKDRRVQNAPGFLDFGQNCAAVSARVSEIVKPRRRLSKTGIAASLVFPDADFALCRQPIGVA